MLLWQKKEIVRDSPLISKVKKLLERVKPDISTMIYDIIEIHEENVNRDKITVVYISFLQKTDAIALIKTILFEYHKIYSFKKISPYQINVLTLKNADYSYCLCATKNNEKSKLHLKTKKKK